MHPKKSKELLNKVANKNNQPLKVVEDVTNFYWREVWSQLTNPQAIKIHVENLGDFNIKHWLLDKELNKLSFFDKGTNLKGAQKFAASCKVNERIDTVNNLKILLDEEQQRKDFIYEHKKVTNENKEEKSDSDLEE